MPDERPFRRSAVVLGKLAAGVPLVVAMLTASIVIAYVTVQHQPGSASVLRAVVAIGIGTFVAGLVSVALGSLVPSQAMLVSIMYLFLFDQLMGRIPFAINKLTLSHHVLAIAKGEALVNPLLWLSALGTVWSGIAIWRVTRTEFHSAK